MNFEITPTSPTPIYRQIVEQVRRLIAGRKLSSGDELPSVRAVALHHAINPMTVSKAYSLLETEGLLVRKRGIGMAVADAHPKSTQQDKFALLRPALMSAAQITRQLRLSDSEAQTLFKSCLNEYPKEKIDDK
jgi:GntR family transcriptional regulator